MRILLITGRYPPEPCGVGDYSAWLAKTLCGSGHDVIVLTSGSDDEKSMMLDGERSLQIVRAVRKWDFIGYRRIVQQAVRDKVEVVHIQYQAYAFDCHPMITLLPLFLKLRRRGLGLKAVVTLHELAGPFKAGMPRMLSRICLLPLLFFSDAVVLTNERDMSLLRSAPFLGNRLRLIPLASTVNANSQEIDRESVRRHLRASADEVLVVRFGFVQNVGISLIPELLQSIKRLCDKGYRVRLLLVGGVSDGARSEVLSLAQRLGIQARLLLTGYCSADEVVQYLKSSDMAVQLYPEGVCEKRTGLQAVIAQGLPVVSLRGRHVPSMFIDRENILLARMEDPDELARSMEELILNGELRKKLGAGAMRTAKDFTWEMVGRKTKALYESLMNEA